MNTESIINVLCIRSHYKINVFKKYIKKNNCYQMKVRCYENIFNSGNDYNEYIFPNEIYDKKYFLFYNEEQFNKYFTTDIKLIRLLKLNKLKTEK